MAIGMLVFFTLLFFAVNVIYNLYATSVISSIAVDAARDVAERDGKTAGQAEDDFRAAVSGEVSFKIREEGDVVFADIEWETRALLPTISDARAFGVLNRTFAVRVEEQQVAP